MPQGRTPITWNMTVRDALLNVINEDMEELFSRVEALELGVLSGVAIATEEEAIAGVDNTKAMTPLRTHQAIAANHIKQTHDQLGIDADTLDGYHSTAFRRTGENINLSQGQIIDFADETGDKIQLYGTQYGVAVNPNELTLYAPSASQIAVRNSSYNGQVLGNIIHTGNIDASGVARRISTIASTPGDFAIMGFNSITNTYLSPELTRYFKFYIPWGGVTRYKFTVSNNSSIASSAYFYLNTTEYGPYPLPQYSVSDIFIDHACTGVVEVYARLSDTGNVTFNTLYIMIGNTDVLHALTVLYYLSNNFVMAFG